MGCNGQQGGLVGCNGQQGGLVGCNGQQGGLVGCNGDGAGGSGEWGGGLTCLMPKKLTFRNFVVDSPSKTCNEMRHVCKVVNCMNETSHLNYFVLQVLNRFRIF